MPAISNKKHETFAALVAVSSDASEDITKAYKGAGYKCASDRVALVCGKRLLENAAIAARIVELRSKVPGRVDPVEEKIVQALEKVAIDRDFVMSGLRTVAERCMQVEEVRGKDGKPTGQFVFQAAGANRAFELMGKEIGMFVDRTDNMHRWQALSDVPTDILRGWQGQLKTPKEPAPQVTH